MSDLDNEDLCFQVKYELSDYVKYSFKNLFRKPIFIFIYFTGIISLLILPISLFEIINGSYADDYSNLFSRALMALLIFLIPFSQYSSIKKAYQSDKILRDEHRFIINNDKIEVLTECSSVFIKWQEITNIVWFKDYIGLQISKTRLIIIPKRVFKNNCEALLRLENIIKSIPHLNKKI